MHQMRFLLIGGTGFIGPSVTTNLERLNHEVAVFHRGKRKVAQGVPGSPKREQREGGSPAIGILGDRRHLADFAGELRAFQPDVVIDLILSSGRQARELMDVFRGATSRVVALSSCDVYRACGVTHGLEPGPLEPLPLTEQSALRTKLQTYPPAQVRMLQQIFGWVDEEYDKIPVEREILGDRDLPGTVLRLPMVYGPGDRLHRFLPIMKRIADGRRTILFSADMAQWRATKGYVENVGAAIALAAVSNHAAGRIYNLGEVDALTELEWARHVAATIGWSGEFKILPNDSVPPHLRAPGNAQQHWVTDTTRIREELGYREPIARDEAIGRTAEWERTNPPTGVTPYQFDYQAEDSALQNW